jgi:putative PIN family toxin of toxin-antitoxin system
MKSKRAVKLRTVLDTSVYVAALLSESGGSAQVVEGILKRSYHNFYTDDILHELKSVFGRGKFNVEQERRYHFLHLLMESSFLITPLEQYQVTRCRDPKDDIFLSLANQVDADYLVTLDQDLLVLRRIENTAIVTPKDFLRAHPRIAH